MSVPGPAHVGSLSRPRLLDRLDSPRARLTVLAASSGFGKTTLLREWVDLIDARRVAVIWVTFGIENADPADFWRGVLHVATRQGLLPEAERARVVAALMVDDDPVELLSAYLLRPGSEGNRDVVVVLDAFESMRVPDDVIEDAVAALVRRVPRLRVVVATRAKTSLTAESRVACGDVDVIGEDELTFTPDESAALAERFGREELSAELLDRETRGYPLALRAVLRGIGDMATPADAPHWRSLVAADLLDHLDEWLRRLLLATAVPPYFDVELAQRLTEMVDGPDVHDALAELEIRGLGTWVPFAPGRRVFRYVGAVRDAFLVELIEFRPDLHVRAARAAASWALARGMLTLALELAITGADYALAERVYRSMVLGRSETYTRDVLDVPLAKVPRAVLSRFPVLAFGRAVSCRTNPATYPAAAEYFEIAATHLSHTMSDLDWSERAGQLTMKSVALRALRRFTEAADAAEQALSLYERIEEVDERRLIELRPMVLRQLAYSLFEVGRIDAAVAVVQRAITATTTPWSRNYTAVYNVGFHAFAGRLGAARDAETLVDPAAWPPGDDHTFINALGRIGTATMRLDAFDFAGAERVYDGCDSYLDTSEFWAYINWTLMHARLGQGQALTEAHRIAEALRLPGLPPGVGATIGTSALRGTLAILWLAAGRRNAARDVLQTKVAFPGQVAPAFALKKLLAGKPDELLTMLPKLEKRRGHTVRSRMATQTIAAAAALRQDDDATAAALLRRVAARDAGGGTRLHLLYLPEDDLAALRGLADRMGDRPASTYLDVEVPALLSSTEAVPMLSDRELAVLAAFVDHDTRAEVAAALYVSENTVKTHLKNLYRKLGATTREAALRRAIELDLLP